MSELHSWLTGGIAFAQPSGMDWRPAQLTAVLLCFAARKPLDFVQLCVAKSLRPPFSRSFCI
jgi:hypothetical protein